MNFRRFRRRRLIAALGGVGVLMAVLAPVAVGATAEAGAPPPNVVFVLTDDLSWNLIQYLPQVQALQRDGLTFDDYTVTDSLCCPSRSSILSGRYPHDTGVFTNGGDDGGFHYFQGHGEEAQTFATALHARGYRTAMMGKYLNEYEPSQAVDGSTPYVPPGWDEWDVAGDGGYTEFNYDLAENHTVKHYGVLPQDYLTDVLSRKGASFIKSSASAHKPFMLEVATFAPHKPSIPAPRDALDFPGLTAPRGPAYNTLPTDPPAWLADRQPLTPAQQDNIDKHFRLRAQSVQAVDDLIKNLRSALASAGVARDTYLVFSSDNGYHMGEYRLNFGKMTAFDTDIRVPLVVTGPGVKAGTSSTAAVENTDLAPTFERLAGADVPDSVDGRSLVPLLHGESAAGWRTAGLVEHHGPDTTPNDPDAPDPGSGDPPSYEAMRTATYTYVEYVDGSREYYDLVNDPYELHNLAGSLGADRLAALHAALAGLENCHDGRSCWAAGHVTA